MSPSEVISTIGGLPFINVSFDGSKLLTLAAVVRSNADNKKHKLSQYFNPTIAHKVYQDNSTEMPTPLPHRALYNGEILALSQAKKRIIETFPEWHELFAIPLIVKKLSTDQPSSSNPKIPQAIYLGESVFATEILLEETFIHELSHIWCSLITEIYDFQEPICPSIYSLPSGTSGKDIRGILLASLFSATAITYHLKLIENPKREHYLKRTLTLFHYFRGTLQTLQVSPHLSETGKLITRNLSEFSSALATHTILQRL